MVWMALVLNYFFETERKNPSTRHRKPSERRITRKDVKKYFSNDGIVETLDDVSKGEVKVVTGEDFTGLCHGRER